MRIKKDIIDSVFVAFMILIAIFFVLGAVTDISPVKMVVIDNRDPNSMHPTYLQGDIFALQRMSPEDYRIGDVIVYKPATGGGLIIHRVINIEEVNGKRYFTVKGDNYISNYEPDPYGEYRSFISEDSVVGKILFKVPFLGHFSLAIQYNNFFRILVLFIAGGVMLHIIFSKDDEDEGKEEYFEISRERFRVLKTHLINTLHTPKGKIYVSMVVLVVLILIPATIAPGVFYQNDKGYAPGLISVGTNSIANRSVQTIDGVTVSTVFYQVVISFYDSGMPGGRMRSIVTEAFVDGSNDPISHTVYNNLGAVIGVQTFGGSVIFDSTSVPNVDQTLEVVVTLTFDSGETSVMTTTINHSAGGS